MDQYMMDRDRVNMKYITLYIGALIDFAVIWMNVYGPNTGLI